MIHQSITVRPDPKQQANDQSVRSSSRDTIEAMEPLFHGTLHLELTAERHWDGTTVVSGTARFSAAEGSAPGHDYVLDDADIPITLTEG